MNVACCAAACFKHSVTVGPGTGAMHEDDEVFDLSNCSDADFFTGVVGACVWIACVVFMCCAIYLNEDGGVAWVAIFLVMMGIPSTSKLVFAVAVIALERDMLSINRQRWIRTRDLSRGGDRLVGRLFAYYVQFWYGGSFEKHESGNTADLIGAKVCIVS
jgi:hypothetical protein